MLATIHGSDDDGIGVEVVTENLTRIGKLEDALTDFRNGAVDFIEEEEHRAIAGISQPIGRAERSHLAIGLGKTNEVALGHLGGAPFDDGQPHRGRDLIDKLRLANAMSPTKHERLTHVQNMRGNGNKSFEIDSHDFSIRPRG